MTDTSVPIIDIGAFLAGDPGARKSIPEAVARACERIGFFTIVGHGIGPDIISGAKGAANAFFDLPTADKMRVRSSDPALSRGYRGIGNEGLAGTARMKRRPTSRRFSISGPPTFRTMPITPRPRRCLILSTMSGRHHRPAFARRSPPTIVRPRSSPPT